MALEVDIVSVDDSGARVEAFVTVTETGDDNTDFTLEIVDETANVTGGRTVATEGGTLFGGSRGTQQSFDVSFVPEESSGTFRAEVSEDLGQFEPGVPERDSERADFEVDESAGSPGGTAEIDVVLVETFDSRVEVTVRVFNPNLGQTDYSANVSLDWGSDFADVQFSGTVGSGEGADRKTIEFIPTNPDDEAFLTAALNNGNQVQQTIQLETDDGTGGTDPGDGDDGDDGGRGGGGGGDDPGDGGGGGPTTDDYSVFCTGCPNRSTVGETVSFGYEILSLTDSDATVTVNVVVDGTVAGEDVVRVGAGEVLNRNLEVQFRNAGERQVSLEVVDAQV
jgi:hypothetical protein